MIAARETGKQQQGNKGKWTETTWRTVAWDFFPTTVTPADFDTH